MKERVGALIILVCVAMGTKVGEAQADNISVMRMHLECGWFIQLSSNHGEIVTKLSEFHIVAGSYIAADLGLTEAELAEEVTQASERVRERFEIPSYVSEMMDHCSSAVALR